MVIGEHLAAIDVVLTEQGAHSNRSLERTLTRNHRTTIRVDPLDQRSRMRRLDAVLVSTLDEANHETAEEVATDMQ
jgi:hypothetical protein